MGSQKNKINGVLIVIIVILLGIIAFCAYKIGTMGRCVVDDSNVQKGGNTSVTFDDTVVDKQKESTTSDTITRVFNETKYYQYYVTYTDEGINYYYTEEIELNPDGTAKYKSAGDGVGGTSLTGTYKIENDKISFNMHYVNTTNCGVDFNGYPNPSCYKNFEFEILKDGSFKSNELTQSFVDKSKHIFTQVSKEKMIWLFKMI